MPIRDLMRYNLPEAFKLTKEKDIIDLLKDVRKCINKLEYMFEANDLKKVLETIGCGKHIIGLGATKDIEVDLSHAYKFVEEYKSMSEGGCIPCKHIIKYKPFSDETCFYCGLYEDESEKTSGRPHSQRIKKYFEEGCDDRVPIFRPIEEVLNEVKG